jgi:hypothetical protein
MLMDWRCQGLTRTERDGIGHGRDFANAVVGSVGNSSGVGEELDIGRDGGVDDGGV